MAQEEEQRSASPERQQDGTEAPDRSRERSRSPVAREEKSEDPILAKLEEIFAAGTVKKEDLGDEFVEELRGLKEEEAFYVIDRVGETDFKTVRSPKGFALGIIRRVKDFGMEIGEPDFSILGEDVKQKLEDLIAAGKFERSDLDFRVVRTLQKLGEYDRKLAIERYECSLDDTIRSKQGFFMGIVKRMLPQQRNVDGRRGFGGRSSYGGRRDDRRERSHYDRYRPRDRYDDRRRDDRPRDGDRYRSDRRY